MNKDEFIQMFFPLGTWKKNESVSNIFFAEVLNVTPKVTQPANRQATCVRCKFLGVTTARRVLCDMYYCPDLDSVYLRNPDNEDKLIYNPEDITHGHAEALQAAVDQGFMVKHMYVSRHCRRSIKSVLADYGIYLDEEQPVAAD